MAQRAILQGVSRALGPAQTHSEELIICKSSQLQLSSTNQALPSTRAGWLLSI